jgi:hypothetical protein
MDASIIAGLTHHLIHRFLRTGHGLIGRDLARGHFVHLRTYGIDNLLKFGNRGTLPPVKHARPRESIHRWNYRATGYYRWIGGHTMAWSNAVAVFSEGS